MESETLHKVVYDRVRPAVLAVIAAAAVAAVFWLAARARLDKPFPARLSALISNPLVDRISGVDLLIRRAGVRSGMRVLDAGCGPGRMTVRLAHTVGTAGEVVALDVQEAMLERVRERAARVGAIQVRTLRADLGVDCSPATTLSNHFDRALLITVLGEIGNRPAALACLYKLLAPHGLLSITETVIDPDYVRRADVTRLAEEAGFMVDERMGTAFMFTINCRKRDAETSGIRPT